MGHLAATKPEAFQRRASRLSTFRLTAKGAGFRHLPLSTCPHMAAAGSMEHSNDCTTRGPGQQQRISLCAARHILVELGGEARGFAYLIASRAACHKITVVDCVESVVV
jgi:hypothetical protein